MSGIRPSITADLPSIYAFISREDSSAADRVLDAIEQTFEHLMRQPECGVRYRPRNRKLTDVRMLPVAGFENYLVFYRVERDAMRILYVLHGARHLREFFHREPRR